MRNIIFVLICFLNFANNSAFSQKNEEYITLQQADTKAEPLIGYEEISQLFFKELAKYELNEIDTLNCDDIRGCKVIIRFTVDKNGITKDYRIFKGLGSDYDSICLNIVKQLQVAWKPGMLNGEPVNMLVPMVIYLSPNQ